VNTSERKDTILRGTGLLVIEVINSNPNGDPDRESDPRQRGDGRGEISPVSFKRKLRDLIDNKEGPVWSHVRSKFGLSDDEYRILESRGRVRKDIERELVEGTFTSKYWDGRVFGNTFLEEGASPIFLLSSRGTSRRHVFSFAVSDSPHKGSDSSISR
jgi:CRISPR-associated protein Csd2